MLSDSETCKSVRGSGVSCTQFFDTITSMRDAECWVVADTTTVVVRRSKLARDKKNFARHAPRKLGRRARKTLGTCQMNSDIR